MCSGTAAARNARVREPARWRISRRAPLLALMQAPRRSQGGACTRAPVRVCARLCADQGASGHPHIPTTVLQYDHDHHEHRDHHHRAIQTLYASRSRKYAAPLDSSVSKRDPTSRSTARPRHSATARESGSAAKPRAKPSIQLRARTRTSTAPLAQGLARRPMAQRPPRHRGDDQVSVALPVRPAPASERARATRRALASLCERAG